MTVIISVATNRNVTCQMTHVAVGTPGVQVPSFTNTKLLWLKRNEPDVWSKVASAMLPHDYINFWLTGNKVTEVCGRVGATVWVAVSGDKKRDRLRLK